LKPGGFWINHGPLQWHFEAAPTPDESARGKGDGDKRLHEGAETVKSNEGIGEPGSFQLTDVEVKKLLERFGFEIVEAKIAPAGDAGYIQNPRSMLQTTYRPSFWMAKKL
jgi:carnosine N-methyltransferase